MIVRGSVPRDPGREHGRQRACRAPQTPVVTTGLLPFCAGVKARYRHVLLEDTEWRKVLLQL